MLFVLYWTIMSKNVSSHIFSSWFGRTDDQKERRWNMFATSETQYEWSRWGERERKDTSKCGDCHCIRILRLSADVYTSQKGPVEQSFSTHFISLTYILSLSLSLCARFFSFRSCIYNWWTKAQILNIRRDDRRTKRTNNHLTSFCLYSSYSRQTIVIIYNFSSFSNDQISRRSTSFIVSIVLNSSLGVS